MFNAINVYVISTFPHFYGVSRGWQQSSSYAHSQPSVGFGSMICFPLMKRTVCIGELALYCYSQTKLYVQINQSMRVEFHARSIGVLWLKHGEVHVWVSCAYMGHSCKAWMSGLQGHWQGSVVFLQKRKGITGH